MLRSRLFLIALVSAILIIGSLAVWAAVENDNDNEDKDESIALSNVPAKVIEAANKAVSDGTIVTVEKETENGEEVYEVKMVVSYEVKVTKDGIVKKVEKIGDNKEKDDDDNDKEEKVALSDVPAKVLDAANQAVPGGKIEEVEKDTENGEIIYCIVKDVDGVKYEIDVTADGAVKKTEKDDDSEEDDD